MVKSIKINGYTSSISDGGVVICVQSGTHKVATTHKLSSCCFETMERKRKGGFLINCCNGGISYNCETKNVTIRKGKKAKYFNDYKGYFHDAITTLNLDRIFEDTSMSRDKSIDFISKEENNETEDLWIKISALPDEHFKNSDIEPFKLPISSNKSLLNCNIVPFELSMSSDKEAIVPWNMIPCLLMIFLCYCCGVGLLILSNIKFV